ncbi:ATP-binding protein [Amycolatopsis pigmentata]|uniref:ATP-binding protein n=1 Tax=Amycolatopsis pigmentata TaxID=450801 RepID=A0ABW5FYK2_9PSEU
MTKIRQREVCPVKDSTEIEVAQREQAGCAIARLTGRLDSLNYLRTRDQLIKLALEEPRAVVVEVDGLEVPSEPLLTVFSAAWMKVSQWPGVPILVVATDVIRRRWLKRCAFSRFVPVFADIDEAVDSLGVTPMRRRATIDLAAEPSSAALARRFVRGVCAEWSVEPEIEEVVCVASELVENVVKHADTVMQLRLELRDRLLTVAVRDGSPHQAVLRQSQSGLPVGLGLRIVSHLSRTWGCTPDIRGGKVVWAAFKAGPEWFFRKFPPWRSG